MNTNLLAIVLSFLNLASLGLLAVAWRQGRMDDRRRLNKLRRELLDWLKEAKIENGSPVPSWMVEP